MSNDVPGTPVGPTTLTETGAGGWLLPVGICDGLAALACELTLWFGRRPPQCRERNGYVRKEDQKPLDLLSDGG